jgi:hypothetical protein
MWVCEQLCSVWFSAGTKVRNTIAQLRLPGMPDYLKSYGMQAASENG